MDSKNSAETHLPLRPVEFQVLVSLSRGQRHGYGMIQDAEARGEKGAVPGLATLYRALTRMERAGLIERCEQLEPIAADQENRRYFCLTALGKRVARAEARRLEKLVRLAREAELLEGERTT